MKFMVIANRVWQRSYAFVGQLDGDTARGRWVCAGCGVYAFPRNAWTSGAVATIRGRRA